MAVYVYIVYITMYLIKRIKYILYHMNLLCSLIIVDKYLVGFKQSIHLNAFAVDLNGLPWRISVAMS